MIRSTANVAAVPSAAPLDRVPVGSERISDCLANGLVVFNNQNPPLHQSL